MGASLSRSSQFLKTEDKPNADTATPPPLDEDAVSQWLAKREVQDPNAEDALHAGLINGNAYRELFEAQAGVPLIIPDGADNSRDMDEPDDAAALSVVAEKPVWLDFTATPIRKDVTTNVSKKIHKLRRKGGHAFFNESELWLNMLTEQLVALVLNGMEDRANALIQACPFLLERRATVTCPVGRVYQDVTAYEAALYAGDTQMCEMMHPFFERLGERGETMRLEQCHTVFPDGVRAVIDAQQAYDFNSLIDVISKASADDVKAQLENKVTYTELGQAINLFREDFVTLSKQEQHANLKHLLEAFRAYADDERIAEWERTRDYDKMRVFWCQVIGFVQLYLPECDKQVFHQGLYDVIENNKRLSREVDFKYDRGHSLHILEDFSGCGFDFAGPFVARGWDVCAGVGRRDGCWPFVENLCQTKTSILENLCSRGQAARNHA